MSTTPDLLPCPFCGQAHTAKVQAASDDWDVENEGPYPNSESWFVVCDASSPGGPGGCGASSGYNGVSPESAARQWNARAALSTHTEQAAEGWQLVPKEPTPEMVARALRECGGIGGGSCGEHTGADADDMRSVWESMLAAAPQPATHTEHAEIQRLRAELAAERERWKEVLEDRGRIHGESSRIYARLAGAVRAGADDAALSRMLRDEVRNRA